MTPAGAAQILVFFGLVLLATKPMGAYMVRVFDGERTLLHPVLRPIECLLYRVARVDEGSDMRWTAYGLAVLTFSLAGGLVTYALLRLQGSLPLNPQHFGGKEMTPDLAFNTAMSFMTNTNWQNYVPETTVSCFSNMVALAMHNWMSAATGIAVAIAIVRGFARQAADGLGNFWVDVTRATVYVLLPLCLVIAPVLVWQGVPQNFGSYVAAATLEGAEQTIPQGPVASQEAIKMVGTNGGGFFNANSSHPYENPTPLSNLVELLAIFVIPAGLTHTFGKMVRNTRQGWALFGAMTVMFAVGVSVCYRAEARGNPSIADLGVVSQASDEQPGGNMEGKEQRFGIGASALFAVVTTDASCGAVNSMHDSYTPVGGAVPLANIMCDEVIFGGVGAGLYGMLMYAVIAVFIAGLMVGRTPEYVGKKIDRYEVRMAVLTVLILVANILLFSALATNANLPPGSTPVAITDESTEHGAALMGPTARWNHVNNSSPSLYDGATWNNVNNPAAHGFSEILYAFSSATGNNGSAFAGLTGNTPFYNVTLGLAMLIGRFLMLVPLLAMAGSLGRKKLVPASAGTLATDSVTFAFWLMAVVLIIGGLEYFCALALGPIVEHFQMVGRVLL